MAKREKMLNEKCRKCLYTVAVPGNKYGCGYMLLNSKSRGCGVQDCDRFEKMNKKKRQLLDCRLRAVYRTKRFKDEYDEYISERVEKGVR